MDAITRAQIETLGFLGRSSLRGETLKDLFRDAERAGATVWWGFWSIAQLDAILPPMSAIGA